jgi:hypothetical protein
VDENGSTKKLTRRNNSPHLGHAASQFNRVPYERRVAPSQYVLVPSTEQPSHNFSPVSREVDESGRWRTPSKKPLAPGRSLGRPRAGWTERTKRPSMEFPFSRMTDRPTLFA